MTMDGVSSRPVTASERKAADDQRMRGEFEVALHQPCLLRRDKQQRATIGVDIGKCSRGGHFNSCQIFQYRIEHHFRTCQDRTASRPRRMKLRCRPACSETQETRHVSPVLQILGVLGCSKSIQCQNDAPAFVGGKLTGFQRRGLGRCLPVDVTRAVGIHIVPDGVQFVAGAALRPLNGALLVECGNIQTIARNDGGITDDFTVDDTLVLFRQQAEWKSRCALTSRTVYRPRRGRTDSETCFAWARGLMPAK